MDDERLSDWLTPKPFPKEVADIISKHNGRFSTHPGSGGPYSGPTDIEFDHRLPLEDVMLLWHFDVRTSNGYQFKGWLRCAAGLPLYPPTDEDRVCVPAPRAYIGNPSGGCIIIDLPNGEQNIDHHYNHCVYYKQIGEWEFDHNYKQNTKDGLRNSHVEN